MCDLNLVTIDGAVVLLVWTVICECEYRLCDGTHDDDILIYKVGWYWYWVASSPPFQMKYILII
jgi:hypothetical protein